MLRRNAVDIGAFGQFFGLEQAFLNYDVNETEFKNQLTTVSS